MALRLGDEAPNFTAETTERIIVPAVKNEGIPGLFPKGAQEVKPYLRYTPQPNK